MGLKRKQMVFQPSIFVMECHIFNKKNNLKKNIKMLIISLKKTNISFYSFLSDTGLILFLLLLLLLLFWSEQDYHKSQV